jgi:hypothetical protein
VQIEGQDTTSQNDPNWTSTVSHTSFDMIQEFSLQTSNFAAEFSQVGGVSITSPLSRGQMISTVWLTST